MVKTFHDDNEVITNFYEDDINPLSYYYFPPLSILYLLFNFKETLEVNCER